MTGWFSSFACSAAGVAVRECVEGARAAQPEWARTSIAERLRCVRRLRDAIARQGQALCGALDKPAAESLSSEILPLAEACRFLELTAQKVLRPERVAPVGRPLWLRGVSVEMRHEPVGVVLVIGPANYPLFLPGVQVVQALVAGNAALVKPGRGGGPVMKLFAELLGDAGFPVQAVSVLDESAAAAQDAIEARVDKIFITGSMTSGQAVLRSAAEMITPVVAELSGDDPVIVLPGADLDKVARALNFCRELNGGNTCIAPKRVFVHQAIAAGVAGLSGLQTAVFFSNAEVVRAVENSAFALGATIFGPEKEARELAAQIKAGVVVINDVIVPTADPRVCFGGRKASGFGKTRGVEGLREMTVTKAVVVQRARRLRHLEAVPAGSEALFSALLEATNRVGFLDRWKGWKAVCRAAVSLQKTKQWE